MAFMKAFIVRATPHLVKVMVQPNSMMPRANMSWEKGIGLLVWIRSLYRPPVRNDIH